MTPENSLYSSVEPTKRPVNAGAEKWLGEVIPVLDHGFVYLVDYLGGDADIARAARVSYGEGTRSVSEDRTLIRYLMRHNHTSPFEMVELKFHAKMPIFVARQWIRHRTASVNEYSARYSVLPDEFYVPEAEMMGNQSKSNRQGREEAMDPVQAEKIRQLLINDAFNAYRDYRFMLNDNGEGKPIDPQRDMLSRELARMNLSLNFYTQWYWKIDLHNLLHFLELRMAPQAQNEIRVYAEAMAKVVADVVPLTWEAFQDYRFGAINFSGLEKKVIGSLVEESESRWNGQSVSEACERAGLTNKREKNDFFEKLKELGFLRD